MSDIFASATVRITPSLTDFKKDLEKDLVAIMAKVKVPPVRVRPALTKDFIGDLRKQVDAAILKAQKGLKPVRIKALIEPVGVATGPAGVISGRAPVGSAATGAAKKVSETTLVTNANKLLAASEERLAGIEDKVIVKTTEAARALVRYEETAKALPGAQQALALALQTTNTKLQQSIAALVEKIEVEKKAKASALELARAQAAVQKTAPARGGGPSAQARGTTSGLLSRNRAALKLADAGIKAQERLSEAAAVAGRQSTRLASARSFLSEVTHAEDVAERALSAALRGSNIATIQALDNTHRLAVAQREQATTALNSAKAQAQIDTENRRAAASQASAARTSARSQAQLSRGAQASLLSIGGVRGATLAASRSFLVGAAAITIFAKAVQSFADLETNLEVFRATTSSTADEMTRVRDAAVALGADLTLPNVSAGDAAGAMVELAKAGLSVQDSITGARGVLELATAAAIDNAAATQLVANALNAFGLQGRDAITIADTFANAANAAQGSIADIGTAFQQAAAAGRQVGLSFQDTSLFLTILAKNGLRGSDAGTSLRTALIRLVHPSKEAAKELKGLGVEIRDAAGNLRPDVFIQIAEATKKLSPAARDAVVALVGGQDAFRAITILGRQTIEQFIGLRKALREQGTAAELAAARTKGLHGSVEALGSVLQTVGTELGASVGPGLASFTRNLAQGVTALANSEQVAKTLNDTLATTGAAFNAIGTAALAAAKPVLFFASALQQVVNAIGISTLLAGAAAFKLLPRIFTAVNTAVFATTVTMRALGPIMLTSGLRVAGLRAALVATGASFNVYAIAAAAAVAGLVFLATRQSALEKSLSSLTKTTDRYIETLSRLKGVQGQLGDIRFTQNAAQLAVITAKQAASSAKANLANSNAAKGSFARTKLILEAKVAIDQVAAAEQAYKDVLQDVTDLEELSKETVNQSTLARQDQANALVAASKEIQKASKFVANAQGGGPRDVAERAQLFASKALRAEFQKRAQQQRALLTIEGIDAAKRFEALNRFIGLVKRAPTDVEFRAVFKGETAEKGLKALIKAAGDTGGLSAEAFVLAMTSANPWKRLVKDALSEFKAMIDGLILIGTQAGKVLADKTVDAAKAQLRARLGELQQIIKNSFGRLAGLDIQENLDVIGSDAVDATLGTAQSKLREATRIRAAAEAQIKTLTGAGKTKGLATARENRAKAIADQRQFTEQIRGIDDQLAADAKSAADDAKQKRDERDQAFLDLLGLGRDRAQQKVTNAQATEGLQDDIGSNRKLKALINTQIASIKARLKAGTIAAKAAAAAIRELRLAVNGIDREITALNKQRQERIAERAAERIDLDIEFASITENVNAEIAARRRKITQLIKLKNEVKKGSIAYKQYRNAIAEQIKAIKDLTKTKDQETDATAAMQFAFLQRQQGFAANLLGNLIPMGATSGLLGGTTGTGGGGSPTDPLRQVAGGFEQPRGASKLPKPGTAGPGGPSRGGQASQTHLLREILRVLNNIYRGTGHPEAHHRRRTNPSAMSLDHLGT